MSRLNLIFLFVLLTGASYAQEVPKSDKTTVVDGKMYYVHTVAQGQTLYSIAKAYEVSVKQILENNNEAIDGLKPGQELRIPLVEVKKDPSVVKQEDGKEKKYKTYKVKKGDTWFSIAKKYNISVEQLKAFNPEHGEKLTIGTELRIPSVAFTPKDVKIKDVGVTDPKLGDLPVVISPDSVIKKESYNIGFLLPFNFGLTLLIDPEKIRKGSQNFPEKSKLAIEFYQGVKLAMDSLKRKGFNVNATYFDTGADSSGASWLRDPELAKMDLIIGPFFNANFSEAAKFAKKQNINIIPPSLQNNKILLGNPNVYKMTPSTYTQMEQTGDFVADNFPDHNLILVNTGGPKDLTIVNAVKNKANAKLLLNKKDTLKVVTGYTGVIESIVKGKVNVVVLPSSNQSYVTDFLSRLYKVHMDRKDSIVIVGMNSWTSFDNLDPEYLEGMAFHYPGNSFIAYSDTSVMRFISNYRMLYKTEPSEYVYDGFDVSWYSANLLQNFGVNFGSKVKENPWDGIANRFRFENAGVDSGYENTGVYMLRYKDYVLRKAN